MSAKSIVKQVLQPRRVCLPSTVKRRRIALAWATVLGGALLMPTAAAHAQRLRPRGRTTLGTTPIRRIGHRPVDPCRGNEAPIADPGPAKAAEVGESVLFDGEASFDPDGTLQSYHWDFGDGTDADGKAVIHEYEVEGTYTVTLSVTDDCGAGSEEASATVEVTDPDPCAGNQPPVADAGADQTGETGQSLLFDGGASRDPDGRPDGSDLSYAWNFGDGQTGSGASVTHAYQADGEYTVTLTVTDDCGTASAGDSAIVRIEARPPPEPPNPVLVGFIPGIGRAGGVAVGSNGPSTYAYVASEDFGLAIVDISDPTDPQLKSTLGLADIPASAKHVAVDGDVALIGGPTAFTKVIDVSDPDRPFVVGTISSPASGIAVDGTFGYLAAGAQGFNTVDLKSLEVIGSASMFARAVEVIGIDDEVWAFVAAGRDGLKIVNVTDSESPVVLDVDSPLEGFESASKVALHATDSGEVYAYVAAAPTVYVFNVTDPSAATAVGTLSIGQSITDLTVSGNQLVVGTASPYQVRVFDLSAPEAPVLQGSMNLYVLSLASQGNWVYAASGSEGLRVIDIQDPANPRVEATEASVVASRRAVALENNLALVGGTQASATLVDVSDPQSPFVIGTVPRAASGLAIKGSYGYIAASAQGLQILNLSGANIVGSASMFARAIEVMEIDDELWVFVAAGRDGLKIVNVSNALSPVVLDLDSPLEGFESASKVALYATRSGEVFAYVAAAPTVHVFNVTDPSTATAVGTLSIGRSITGLTMAGNQLVVGTANPYQVRVFDLSAPEAPLLQGSMNLYVVSLASEGSWVYAASGSEGLRVIDISDPSDPRLFDTVGTPGYVHSVSVKNGFAVLGDEAAVLDVVDLHAP